MIIRMYFLLVGMDQCRIIYLHPLFLIAFYRFCKARGGQIDFLPNVLSLIPDLLHIAGQKMAAFHDRLIKKIANKSLNNFHFTIQLPFFW